MHHNQNPRASWRDEVSIGEAKSQHTFSVDPAGLASVSIGLDGCLSPRPPGCRPSTSRRRRASPRASLWASPTSSASSMSSARGCSTGVGATTRPDSRNHARLSRNHARACRNHARLCRNHALLCSGLFGVDIGEPVSEALLLLSSSALVGSRGVVVACSSVVVVVVGCSGVRVAPPCVLFAPLSSPCVRFVSAQGSGDYATAMWASAPMPAVIQYMVLLPLLIRSHPLPLSSLAQWPRRPTSRAHSKLPTNAPS